MGALDGTLRLSQLTIPGTHDSCALHEPFAGTAKCQTLGLRGQLDAGVRFLDIRCRRVGGAFQIYHGAVSQKMSFDDVRGTCLEFLRAHPTECLVMSVKEEEDAIGAARPFAEMFEAYAAKDPGAWYLGTAVPALGEVRGRIVLLRRFASAKPMGIDAGLWRDNALFDAGSATARLRVQDCYRVGQPETKWQAVAAQLEEARTGDAGVLYLNFASGYQPRAFGVPDITAVSGTVNPRLRDFFAAAPAGRFGIVIVDFAEADAVARILAANFPRGNRTEEKPVSH